MLFISFEHRVFGGFCETVWREFKSTLEFFGKKFHNFFLLWIFGDNDCDDAQRFIIYGIVLENRYLK